MADILKVADLEKAKLHDNFHTEVISGKSITTGGDIDYATNAATGQIQKTLPKSIDDIDWSLVGNFASGVTFTKLTDFALDGDGVQWVYTGSFPFSATAGTVPSEPTYQAVHVRDHNSSSNRNAVGAHDAIYRRKTTVAEIASGVFSVGDVLEVTDQSNAPRKVVAGGTPDGYVVLDAGNGNTAVIDKHYIRSEWCGMVWDGVTDDADAYEAASNYAAQNKIQLIHPAKKTVLGRNVTITGGISQVGGGGWTVYNTATTIYHGNFTITCIGNEPQFYDIVFQGASELTGNLLYMRTADPENDQNVDFKFTRCTFFQNYNPVQILGRGANFSDCMFSLYRRALRIEWPNPFTPTGLLEQSLEFGMRGYIFDESCRFHASSTSGYIIQNTGYNKDNLRGVTIRGYHDTTGSLIEGSLNDFEIDLNVLYGSAPLLLIGDTHKVKNGIIKGTYTGEADPANLNTGIANMLAMTASATIDGVIFDCVARDIRGSAFSLNGTVGTLTIRGDYKKVCKQNDASVFGGTTRYFITKLGGTVGKVRLEGTVQVDAYANNPAYLVNGLTDTQFEQGPVTVIGTPQLFGGNARGRSGTVSRHTYTGDGTVNRTIALPAPAQCVMVFGANPDANQRKAGVAIETSFGGVGDIVMTNNSTLRVTDDFNSSGDVFQYIVVY